MAEKQTFKVLKLSDFSGPHKNGKYENYEADATISSSKGESEVVISVGSKGMAEKMVIGEYIGFMAGKVGDKWKVCILAADNPSLAAPKLDGAGHGSYSGGGKSGGYQKNDNLIVAQCAFKGAVDLILAKKIEYSDIEGETKCLFDMIMRIGSPTAAPSTSVTPERTSEPAKEKTTPQDNTHVLDALNKAGLLADVVKHPNGLDQAVSIWGSCKGNLQAFLATVSQTFGTQPEQADDNLPF
jgi:hypothetical protein